ncbi:hypothetical protein Tco_0802068 [Tanacetum coccineum]|uniref:Uncharacterized protein n=1 Tax=Tanacetum coccineum TaxID=301880 RepID=A0ABQ4ZXR5_9ASTR
MSTHDKIYVTPSHTKKVFRNMKRVGKGFSRNTTTLFPTMMIQAHEEMGEDEAVNEEIDDSLVRAATTASSLEAEHDSGSGPKCQETTGDTIAQTRVLALETTKTNQALEIESLKRRVKKLKKKDNKRTHKLKRLYKVGLSVKVVSSDNKGLGEEDASKQGRKIHDIDSDEDITLASTHFDADIDMFGVHDIDGDEVFVENVDASTVEKVEQSEKVIETEVAAAKNVNLSVVEVTLAQALAALKSEKPKAITTLTKTTTATTLTPASTRPRAKGIVKVQDKGKGKMVKEEHVKKFTKKDQLRLDKELAFKLQAEEEEEEEEERLAKEKAQKVQEANIAWDDIQAKIEIDYELAQRLQQEEQEELTIEENLKRAGDELEQEKAKKQKIDGDQEEAEMKNLMEIVPGKKEVAVDAITLATKPPSIVVWKIVKEGKISFFQIIRADGSSKRYSSFIQMLRDFDREDLETLWILVKAKHGSTRPEEGYERIV